MVDRFALQVQSLDRVSQRTLAIADLVRRRAASGKFTAAEITQAFLALDVPPPGNVHRELTSLGAQGLALHHPDGDWALTPIGKQAVARLALDVAPAVAAASEGAAGSIFAHTDHTVIPHWAAPPRWAAGIARLLERHPFDTNVFCMTRFPSEGPTPDPVNTAIDAARSSLAQFGLTLHLASDAIVEDDLLGNVGAYMWACRYGLGVVEDRAGRGINYNAVIELGGMALTGRRSAILKDVTSPPLPTDLSGQIYRSVDLADGDAVAEAVSAWAENDLNVTRS